MGKQTNYLWTSVFPNKDDDTESNRKKVVDKITSGSLLSNEEKDVLSKRYGLNENEEVHTYQAIGSSMNKSGKQVRDIEREALSKLSAHLEFKSAKSKK